MEIEEIEIPGSIHLLLLLLKPAVQLSFILRQLQLQPQNFGLLSLGEKEDRSGKTFALSYLHF